MISHWIYVFVISKVDSTQIVHFLFDITSTVSYSF